MRDLWSPRCFLFGLDLRSKYDGSRPLPWPAIVPLHLYNNLNCAGIAGGRHNRRHLHCSSSIDQVRCEYESSPLRAVPLYSSRHRLHNCRIRRLFSAEGRGRGRERRWHSSRQTVPRSHRVEIVVCPGIAAIILDSLDHVRSDVRNDGEIIGVNVLGKCHTLHGGHPHYSQSQHCC